MKTQTTTLYMKSTQAMQIEDNKATADTQTDNPQPETNKHYVSRVNPYIFSQEEYAPNEEPPTMSNSQLEASNHMIMEGIVATINQATRTESEEDIPPFCQKLQKVLGVKFIAAATRKDRNLGPLINLVKNWIGNR